MPTWIEFEWAVFIYGAIGGDPIYKKLMEQEPLLNALRRNPSILLTNDIREKIIRGFLNQWSCHVHNNSDSAKALKRALRSINNYLVIFHEKCLSDINFNQSVRINNVQMSYEEAMEYCYASIVSIGYNFGKTATSKLLHVLNPKLFVMWDKPIFEAYNSQNPSITDSARGYIEYLKVMQQSASQLQIDFCNDPRMTSYRHLGPAGYLSLRLNFNPHKTLAKFLDEYNWVTITNKVTVPPQWHPCES